MAKVRDFKKDIDFVVNELVIECFTYNYLFPEKNKDEIAGIISESIKLGSDLIVKVNAVKGTKELSAKKQFKTLRNEFVETVESLVQRIEKLEKE